jgi:hypothetical protein
MFEQNLLFEFISYLTAFKILNCQTFKCSNINLYNISVQMKSPYYLYTGGSVTGRGTHKEQPLPSTAPAVAGDGSNG